MNGVTNGSAGGLGHHGADNGSGAFLMSPQPPPSTAPVLSIGSAYSAASMQTTLPGSKHSQPGAQGASQQPPVQNGIGNRIPTTRNGKVAIVEPPGQVLRCSSDKAASFGSPTRDHDRVLPKFTEDTSRLTHAVQQSVPEAVRRVVRDNWEKTLLGTEFHQAFVMNAVIHHANGMIIKRAIKEFGHKMVSESKNEIIEHFRTEDLDDVADMVLDKASDGFLDKALERRLGSIGARSLINALARAERLGYENSDVVDERPGLTPSRAEPFPSASSSQTQLQYQQPASTQPASPQPAPTQPNPSQERRGGHHPPVVPDLQCRLCWRKFNASAPYEYHVKKQLCTKTPPTAAGFDYSCEHCGAGFITHVGQQYHSANKVCGAHGMAPATPKDDAAMRNSPIVISGASSPAISVATTSQVQQRTPQVIYPAVPSAATQSTPNSTTQYSYIPRQTPKVPVSSSAGATPGDPYAHLTAETRARLNEELLAAEEVYAPRFKALEGIADLKVRKDRFDSLQNTFSTKQSIIRKKYGVRLRKRRTTAELEAERNRIQQWNDTPSVKRQRTDLGGGNNAVWRSTEPRSTSTPTISTHPNSTTTTSVPPASTAPSAPEVPRSNHLSVADMNSTGLGGSSATVATTDPTVSLPQSTVPRAPVPGRSLSSMQRSGYRISTHASRHSVSTEPTPEREEQEPASEKPNTEVKPRPTAQTPSMSAQPPKRGGSAAVPVVLDDESSSDNSDSDEEIPAHVPPSRPTSN